MKNEIGKGSQKSVRGEGLDKERKERGDRKRGGKR